jgi:hypothetical protein
VASEALEAFGGAGYIEDTGLPQLLRNAQVLPIWEGTTNVLSLDLLRAATRNAVLPALLEDLTLRLTDADIPALAGTVRFIAAERERLQAWASTWESLDLDVLQAGMRGFALRLGRAYSAALLCEHAAFRLAKANDERATVVARRYTARWMGDDRPVGVADTTDAATIVAAGHAEAPPA